MTEIIFSILPYAAGLITAIGALVWARMSGKRAAENKQQADERKAIDKAKEVSNEINQASDDDINRRLTSWVRGGKR